MKLIKTLYQPIITLLLGVVLCISGWILGVREENLGRDRVLQQVSKKIELIAKQTLETSDKFLPAIIEKKELKNSQTEIKEIKKRAIDLFVYQDEKPIFWTTSEFLPDLISYGGIYISETKTRYLLVNHIEKGNKHYLFTREISKNPEVLADESAEYLNPGKTSFYLSTNPLDGSAKVEIKRLPVFYVVMEDFRHSMIGDIIFFIGAVIVGIGLWWLFRLHSKTYLYALPSVIIWWGILLLGYFYQFLFLHIRETRMFSPEVYASSNYFPNLGVMLVYAILAWFSIEWIKQREKSSYRLFQGKPILRFILWFVFAQLFTGFTFNEAFNLVRDSSLNFDFYEIHKIETLTIIALVILLIAFKIIFDSCTLAFRLFKPIMNKGGNRIAGLVIIAIGFWFNLTIYDGTTALFAGIFLMAWWFSEWVFPEFWRFQKVGFRVVLACLLVTLAFQKEIQTKEKELRKIVASKLLLQNEREPIGALTKTENRLNLDKGIIDYYTCLDVTKQDFEKRLRQLYLSEFQEDFETVIMDFDARGNYYREENAFDFQTVQSLYSSNLCSPVTNHFSYVKDRKLKGSYLGRFEAKEGNEKYGIYFVLLRPRMGSFQGRYADVFSRNPLEDVFSDYAYSYAVYATGRLNRRYGDFNYTNSIVPDSIKGKGDESFYKWRNYSHYYYADELGNQIVVSKPLTTLMQAITNFTVLFLAMLIIITIYYGLLWIRQWVHKYRGDVLSSKRLARRLWQEVSGGGETGLYLSSKIQLYVILVVFTTFIITLYVSINYVSNNYSNRQRNFLWGKTNDIANVLSNQANLEGLFNSYQHGIIYDLSDYYGIDINIYNANGILLHSSNEKIYEQGILSPLLNPIAKAELKENGSSGFIQQESIGTLKYISSYYALFDNDLNVQGYLNLPYFSNRKDLDREISSYAVTLINLFALVFAMAAFIAYVLARRITEPLNLIAHQIGLVKLGNKNQPIEWKHNDEIGLLIREYNKMILELEHSLSLLAESERQGAWREMAKQVAHEIKNPLTPMKLSLQHLKFSMDKNDADLEIKIKRTIELIINQIDALSKMAEEFSAFAKMPEGKPEKMELIHSLSHVVELFSKEENVQIQLDEIPQKVYVWADKHQMERVFTNIIKNAIQAIAEDTYGKISISIKIHHPCAEIWVKDNGKGIPQNLKDKIFSPNFSTKNSGMGLGLAISRKIVQQCGGDISFLSTEGHGATFIVKVPLME